MEDVEAEGRARNGHMTDDEGGVTGDENEPPVAVLTPKARPRPRPVRKGASPSKPATQSPSKSPTRSPSPTPGRSSRSLTPLSSIRDSAPPEEPEILETPKASRKRARSDDEDESDGHPRDSAGNDGEGDENAPPGDAPPVASQESEVSEIQIRRKRVRH